MPGQIFEESHGSQQARTYYDSADADNFYYHVWGGEDIHIGLYVDDEDDEIRTASHATVQRMIDILKEHTVELGPKSRVLDLGSGFCGGARHLARTYGCHVTCVNLSATENRRSEVLNKEQNLEHLITIVQANFECLPVEIGENFDVVWSQDAIVHSGARDRVVSEISKVLAPNGVFIFTDVMQADDLVDNSCLAAVYARICLDDLCTPETYLQMCAAEGLARLTFLDHSIDMSRHYRAVRRVLLRKQKELISCGLCSESYVNNMAKGLLTWVEAAKAGHLRWGIQAFRKIA